MDGRDKPGHDQDWKVAFKKMTDACKACHESFRAEEEEGNEGHHHH